jgi:hypothetical protein
MSFIERRLRDIYHLVSPSGQTALLCNVSYPFRPGGAISGERHDDGSRKVYATTSDLVKNNVELLPYCVIEAKAAKRILSRLSWRGIPDPGISFHREHNADFNQPRIFVINRVPPPYRGPRSTGSPFFLLSLLYSERARPEPAPHVRVQ